MTKHEVLKRMRDIGVVPVIRAKSEEQAHRLVEAVANGGVTVVEITMTVPNALQLIQKIATKNSNILVGAGTVLDPETANACIAHGAQFVVSPALNLKTIELCNRKDVAAVPGALTPTEIVSAWQGGADVVKVFPAHTMGGAQYLRSLKAPLPDIELIPTGGVSLTNALSFLEAGAFALGVGADLVDVRAEEAGNSHAISANAARLIEIVRSVRPAQSSGSYV